MNTHEGYSKKTLANTHVLLAGGGDKTLADFLGGIQYVSASSKFLIKTAEAGASWTDLVTLADENVKLVDNNNNQSSPILLKNGTGTDTITSNAIFADGVTVNPYNNSVTATGGFIYGGATTVGGFNLNDYGLLAGGDYGLVARKFVYALGYGKTVAITFTGYYLAIVSGRASNGGHNYMMLIGTGYSTSTNNWRALYKGSLMSWCVLPSALGIEVKNNFTTGNLHITVLILRGSVSFTEIEDLTGTAVTDMTALLSDISSFNNLPTMYWANQSVSSSSSTTTTPQFARVGLGTAINSSYALNVSGDSMFNGIVNIDSDSMGGKTHINFNRASYNYINVPTDGKLTVSVNGASSNKGRLQVTSASVTPGETSGVVTLGTDGYRWKNIYGVLGNYTGLVTVSVATGTAPFSIASTTKVDNLNVDMLDNYHAVGVDETSLIKEGYLVTPDDRDTSNWTPAWYRIGTIKGNNTWRTSMLLHISCLAPGCEKSILLQTFIFSYTSGNYNIKVNKIYGNISCEDIRVYYNHPGDMELWIKNQGKYDGVIVTRVLSEHKRSSYFATNVITLEKATSTSLLVTSSTLNPDSNATNYVTARDNFFAIVSSTNTGTSNISANQSNPYYNLVQDGSVINSILFKAGTGITISSDANGVITFTNSAPDTDTLVTQTATTTNADYELLFSATADNTTRTETSRKTDALLYNPSTKILTLEGIKNSGIILRRTVNGVSNNYARLYMPTLGTANSGENFATLGTIGEAYLVVGNNVARPDAGTEGGANNARGRIQLYGINLYCTTILPQTSDYTASRVFYLPNYNGAMYAVHASSNNAVGSATLPVFVDANGRVTACTSYSAYGDDRWVNVTGDTMTGDLILNSSVCIKSADVTDGSGYGLVSYNSGNIFGAFGNGTIIPTYIRSTGDNLYHRKGKYSSYTDYLIADAGNIVDSAATIGTTATTIATIAGVDITAKVDLHRLYNSKRINGIGWFRVLDVTTYGMSVLVAIGESFQNSSPTASTFIVNLGYSTATITQIDKASRSPNHIDGIRVVKYANGKFYIDVHNIQDYSTGNTAYINFTNLSHNVYTNGLNIVDWVLQPETLPSGETVLASADVVQSFVSNAGATIGTTATTIATVHGVDITAKIAAYVKLDAGAAEQTIKNSITNIANGSIEIWRATSGGHAMIGFANGTTKTLLGMLGFRAADTPTYRNTSGTSYDLLHSGNSSVSGGGSTWGDSITVKINGTSQTLTIPSNPNTDENVKQAATTTSSWRPVILGVNYNSTFDADLTGTSTGLVYVSNNIRFKPSNGNLSINGAFIPGTTNTQTIGSTSWRWGGIYSVSGNFTGQITSSVAVGTPPFVITSTDRVVNLNADMLDGYHASDFLTSHLTVSGTFWGNSWTNGGSLSGKITVGASGWGGQLVLNRTSNGSNWGAAIVFQGSGTGRGAIHMESNDLYVSNAGGTTRYKVLTENNWSSYVTDTQYYLTLNGSVKGTSSTTNLGSFYAPTSSGTSGQYLISGGANTAPTWTTPNFATTSHTHSLSIAADSGTANVTLAHDTTYKLTAGGSELIFTTPSDNNTDTKVSFVSTTNSNSYPLLFKYSTGSTTTANSARFNTGITVTPSTKTITAELFNGPSKYLVNYDEAYTNPGLNAYSLSYYSSCSKTTAANTNGIANPTCISTEYGDWYYHLLMIHKDSAGYFCDLAWRLDSSTDHTMYYRMRRGSSYTGWIKVLTSENYSDYISGGGSGVTVSTVTLASTAYYPIMTTSTGSKTTVYIANPSSGAKFYATSAGVYHTSDIQLKTNISRYFVNKELTENPVRKFDWKSGDGNNIIGFIAQEVEQWCPEAVRIDEFGYKSLNYNATLSALCGYLFDKIKELQNTVKELQEQINTNKC